MATYSGLASVRDDFRCSLCRQKSAFHCEHDTPYRDQLLGTYTQVQNTRQDHHHQHRTGTHVSHSTNATNHHTTHKMSAGQHKDSRHQQVRIQENSAVSHTAINPVSYNYERTYEQKKKKKTCVIL